VRLKPTFWKVRDYPRVYCGWIKPSNDERGFSELWVLPSVAIKSACTLVRANPELTCQIIEHATAPHAPTTLYGQLTDITSLPIDKFDIELTLRAGDLVRYVRRLEMAPFTVIEPGERGIVDFTCARNGTVDIRLEHYHRGLADFDNCAWLVPNTTEDWVEAVEVVQPPATI
jgi:hypothetical protein